MDLQLFIVLIIGVIVSVVVIRGIYRFFFVKKKTGFCGGCSGCEFSPENMYKTK